MRTVLLTVGACLALAALSLLAPSSITYDPWAWVSWGREIAHLDLNTRLGPSWKPLPILFTTPFSIFGEDAAPMLWLVVARAGALLALVAVFRLARRLVPGPGGWLAGAIAAAALATSADLFKNLAMGYSEGLLIAMVVGAVEAHLGGHRRFALWLAFGAALLRPEVWPFAGLYAVYLWIRMPELRVRMAVLAAAVPALWFLPEWWGSGDPFRASARAQEAVGNAPALAEEPARELLRRARWALIAPVEVGVLLALTAAVVALVRARARVSEAADALLEHAVLALAAITAAWVGLVALMTERGYAGNERYLMAPVALACVLSGVGWTRAGEAVGSLLRGGRFAVAAPVAVTLVGLGISIALALPATRARGDELEHDAREVDFQSRLSDDLGRAIDRAGGRGPLAGCGRVATGDYHVPAVAWRLHLHGEQVGVRAEPKGSLFRAPATQRGRPTPARPPHYRLAGSSGRWEISTSC